MKTATDTIAVLGLGQTYTGANTFSALNAMLVSSSGLTVRNPANTFSYTITGAAIAAARQLNLPLITGTDTLASLGLAQTFTGINTMSGLNVITHSSVGLIVRNPANTFSYTITGAAIAAARTLNLPLITGTDTLASLGLAQTFSAAQTFTGGITVTTTDVTITDRNIVLGTTTGTKFGTATTQKLSFWNATPVVQPTTAIAASTFVANTSAIANDTATFDGYTIGQIVKALRTLGILA